jgi:hypothetical protein
VQTDKSFSRKIACQLRLYSLSSIRDKSESREGAPEEKQASEEGGDHKEEKLSLLLLRFLVLLS